MRATLAVLLVCCAGCGGRTTVTVGDHGHCHRGHHHHRARAPRPHWGAVLLVGAVDLALRVALAR